MLDEYVVLPDVFDPAAYLAPEAIEVSLRWLKDALLEDGLVRDLRLGGWSQYCAGNTAGLHRLAKEILTKLRTNNRLRPFEPQLPPEPAIASEWLDEGLASHAVEPVAGIIGSHATATSLKRAELASVERLTGADFWQKRSPSRILARSTTAYLGALGPILQQAASIMFIDPNLDPSAYNYRYFEQLLLPVGQRKTPPLIEIHRSIAMGDGPARTFPTKTQWRERFAPLHEALGAGNVQAEVLFWTDFHDRFLIADVFGLTATAGFDTTNATNDSAMWARMGRANKDEKQQKYDRAVRPEAFKFGFMIGKGS